MKLSAWNPRADKSCCARAAGLEMREALDIAAIAGQVCELVERLGAALDENRQVIGRNGILRDV
jgi:hypothetical protein